MEQEQLDNSDLAANARTTVGTHGVGSIARLEVLQLNPKSGDDDDQLYDSVDAQKVNAKKEMISML